uniref:Uncharacterized protein n=1 Tax=Panagrolaimus sp. JU765 TaxID=591449 RepID=A0AC34QLX1_9BILA
MALDFEWSFQVPAFVFAILGWIASFVALLTPAWQVVYVRELQHSLVFIGAIAVSLILHTGASIVFMFFSQLVEYRFYHVSVSGIYEKHRGYSVYTEFFAIFLFFMSLIFAVVHLIQSHRRGYASTPTKSADSFVGVGPYRHVESYYPRPGSSSSQLDPFENRFAMRELPPLPNGRR